MSRYKKYAEKPTEFLALTGYTCQEFEALLPHFRRCYYERMKQYRLDGKPRGKRTYSDYKNSPLPMIEDKLFFILSYLKTNNLQTVQGALVGISQPKANVWIHCLHPVLNQALAELGELPVRQMEQMTFAEDEETIYFHDGTERPIPRPCDLEQQRLTYSGKRKRHGLKNNRHYTDLNRTYSTYFLDTTIYRYIVRQINSGCIAVLSDRQIFEN